LLKVSGLNIYYGGIHALRGISISVPKDKIVTLIGANGAGKSTMLRGISGLVEVRSGKISFLGRAIQNRPAHRIARMGIAQVPEGRRIFGNLTVEENLLMGSFAQTGTEEEKVGLERVYEIFPRLRERKKQKGGTLSGGEQQMLALGRGLMARPVLLMLDEPSMGLAPKLVHEVFSILRTIHREGMTILLVEQNAVAALHAAHYGYVLQTGRVTFEGPGEVLLQDTSVREAYLGHRLQ
jgi:branched-chain amino acid transport system ATP-binding protein